MDAGSIFTPQGRPTFHMTTETNRLRNAYGANTTVNQHGAMGIRIRFFKQRNALRT